MKQKKLTIVFTHQRLINSFIAFDYVKYLIKHYEISIILVPGLIMPNELYLQGINIVHLRKSKINERISKFALDFNTLYFLNKCISFETRIRHLTRIDISKQINFKSLAETRIFRYLILAILNLSIIRKFSRAIIITLSDFNPNIRKVLQKLAPDKILLISGGAFSNYENVIIKYSKRNDIPSGLLIDNWDNLSSKSIFWRKPNAVAVWGANMAKDAIDIQNFANARITLIGSSRLDSEKSISIKPITGQVLFAGSGWQFSDEIKLLELSAKVLSKHNLTLVYRPHPAFQERTSKQIISLAKLNNIVIYNNEEIKNKNFFYEKESLYSLIEQVMTCKFLIAAHSTVIVEALYFGKKVVAFSGTDSRLLKNMNGWDAYRHMHEIRGNQNVFESDNYDDFVRNLENVIELLGEKCLETNSVPEIIPNFSENYEVRIHNFIESI